MKKIMIAACAAALAAGVQAATVSWASTVKDYGIATSVLDAGLAAGKTYNAATSGNANSMADQISSSTYLAKWAYEITLSYEGLETPEVLKGDLNSSAFNSRKILLSLDSKSIEQGTSAYNVDYSIVLKGTVTDGLSKTWDITSDTISGVFEVPTKGDLSMSTGGPSTWSTAAVPEPTSGLLLLLGVAGLALRRRRA